MNIYKIIIKIKFIVLILLFISCARNLRTNTSISEINNIELNNRDIFYLLFSDINDNWNEYSNNDDFIVNSYHNGKYYNVENDYINIFYATKGGIADAIDVTINKYSNEFYLCNYIGKHFSVIINDYDNEYKIDYPQRGEQSIKSYYFNDLNRYFWIRFLIDDNDIIYEIIYRDYGIGK